jgi:ribosomal protein L37E
MKVQEDDEDWYDDDDDESDEEESGSCPECGGTVYEFTDKCPACGYWLSAADRRALWSNESKPAWVKFTALVLLVALVLSLYGIAQLIFSAHL